MRPTFIGMLDYFHQMWTGSGHMRGIVQPLIALVIGVLDGRLEGKRGLPSIVHQLHAEPESRRSGLRQGLRRLLLPLCIALGASLIFQYINRGEVHFVNAILYALLFVALPYFVARDLAYRAVTHRHTRMGGQVPQT